MSPPLLELRSKPSKKPVKAGAQLLECYNTTWHYNPEDSELLGFWTFPSSGILETRKHDVSETGSVFILR
jgi:hypothetical protein